MPNLIFKGTAAKICFGACAATRFVQHTIDATGLSRILRRKRALPSMLVHQMTGDLPELSREVLMDKENMHGHCRREGPFDVTESSTRYQTIGSRIAARGSIQKGIIRWLSVAVLLIPLPSRGDEVPSDFFETNVRPVLAEKCSRCHGKSKQSSGLRVDSRQSLIQGGSSGPAIVVGDAEQSLLVQAVRRSGDFDMPPDQPLDEAEIRSLEHWIETGAHWPATDRPTNLNPNDRPSQHWAFQQVRRPSVPTVEQDSFVLNPIDAFVSEKLSENQLAFSPMADRRTLIRRVTYALTGLPPRPVDVERFVNDPDPMAYEQLVDRLLDSQQYGEHGARRWLDIARYSDTKGYVYAREERFWTHAWAYRDWVVRAFNSDMPYDRFLLLQLAADQVDDREPHDLAAMGFLTLGRRFLGVERDIIDDRIDVICRGTMGLTVACARCHDHKYDPIPAADYYSLYGVLDSCAENLVRLKTPDADRPRDDQAGLERAEAEQAFTTELHKRQSELQNKLASATEESSDRARNRIADYLFAQSELDKYPANGFDQIFSKDDLLPAYVRRWERYLWDAARNDDPVFAIWHWFYSIPVESFASEAERVTQRIRSASPDEIHPIVAARFAKPPASFRDVCDRYGQVFAEIKSKWEQLLTQSREQGTTLVAGLPDPDEELLRRIMYDPQSPCQVPPGPITESETFFDSGDCTAIWKLQGEVDRWIINSPVNAPFALTLVDQSVPEEPRIFRRGNPLNQGDLVPRQFLGVIGGDQRQPFRSGSGRLELAESIIDPDNPLTARVIVNRIWSHLMGKGLVLTPSDFGTRATKPSHPELLDWLAAEFVANGWSLKQLHRDIVLSATFRQSSLGPQDQDHYQRAVQIDPDNRLVWRGNSRRLTLEEFRDSLLAATGQLDRTIGGKPSKLFEQPFSKRRTLYGLVDRQYLPGTLRIFDFANPDLHVAKRSETTVPQQALFFLNHPLVLERSKTLADLARRRQDPSERIATMFRQVFQRRPTPTEIDDAIVLVRSASESNDTAPKLTRNDWQYGFGAIDEEHQTVTGFTPLPHFTGHAWQGGPQFPDSKLGWVQLTGTGGHPGNDRSHASIRRWIAPRQMTIRIHSELTHEPTQGDGIRAFIVSSRSGVLHAAKIHHDSKLFDSESFDVAAGDTIDFLVDIDEVLNSDQYLWSVSLQETGSDETAMTWDSVGDFPDEAIDRLDGWEQLAQVLLCSNEFMFVD